MTEQALVVDPGFGDTKAVTLKNNAFQPVIFESAVAVPPNIIETSLSPRVPADIIEFGDKTYLIGDFARSQSRYSVATIDRSRVTSDEALALTLSAIARLFARSQDDITLLTTLPDSWRADAKALRNKLQGSHEIRIGPRRSKRTYTIKTALVRPQSLGAYIFNALSLGSNGRVAVQNQKILSGAAGVVDIGFNTVNLGGYGPNGEHRDQFSDSRPLGVHNLIARVTSRIHDDVGTLLPPARISAAFKQGKLELPGSTINFRNGWVSGFAEEHAASIVSQMRTLWGNGRQLDHIIISGGGAGVLGQQIRDQFAHPNTILPKQISQFQVAEGLLLWLMHQMTK